MYTAIIRKMPITNPGIIPAANSARIESIAGDREKYERHARRNDRTDNRRCRRDAGNEPHGITRILHRLDFDLADTTQIGQRRPRHSGKDHTPDHIDVTEPA
jgi:hypothetical protein